MVVEVNVEAIIIVVMPATEFSNVYARSHNLLIINCHTAAVFLLERRARQFEAKRVKFPDASSSENPLKTITRIVTIAWNCRNYIYKCTKYYL